MEGAPPPPLLLPLLVLRWTALAVVRALSGTFDLAECAIAAAGLVPILPTINPALAPSPSHHPPLLPLPCCSAAGQGRPGRHGGARRPLAAGAAGPRGGAGAAAVCEGRPEPGLLLQLPQAGHQGRALLPHPHRVSVAPVLQCPVGGWVGG